MNALTITRADGGLFSLKGFDLATGQWFPGFGWVNGPWYLDVEGTREDDTKELTTLTLGPGYYASFKPVTSGQLGAIANVGYKSIRFAPRDSSFNLSGELFHLDNILIVPFPEKPRLSVARSDGLTFLWPTNAANFLLQRAPTVSGPYTTVTNTAAVQGTNYILVLPAIETPSAFFRLIWVNE